MINDQKYNEVLENGLILDHFHVLCSIRDGTTLPDNRRIKGFINLLNKKGYLDDMKITEKAITFLENAGKEPIENEPPLKVELIKNPNTPLKITDWVAKLHIKCQDKLFELTGKKQQVGKVDKLDKGYPFLPNVIDLGKVLSSCISSYKLTDNDKIEKTIISYIERCAKTNKWLPILRYYILKNGMSSLVTDMENDEPDDSSYKSSQKFI